MFLFAFYFDRNRKRNKKKNTPEKNEKYLRTYFCITVIGIIGFVFDSI